MSILPYSFQSKFSFLNSVKFLLFIETLKNPEFGKLENFANYLHPRTIEILEENNLTPHDFKRLYFEKEDTVDENIDSFIDMWGDVNFIYGIHKVIKNQVEKSSASTYFYQFTYVKGTSFLEAVMNQKLKFKGQLHRNKMMYQN